jgi:hypothetical protein
MALWQDDYDYDNRKRHPSILVSYYCCYRDFGTQGYRDMIT